jgi:arylsulfatase A-like enzyme
MVLCVPMKKRPNIMFILADDHRFETPEGIGTPQIHTPNLDYLCNIGTEFTHAHIMGAQMGAVCVPSRAMLNTGKYLFHLENKGRTTPNDHMQMGEWFKSNGYYTFCTGKWDNSTEAFNRSFSDGENIFFGGADNHWNVGVCSYHKKGDYPEPVDQEVKIHLGEGVPLLKRKSRYERFATEKHSTDLFTDSAVHFLKSYTGDDPFFCYLSFLAPHDPRTMPREFREKYNPDDIPLPDNFMPCHPFDHGHMILRDELLSPWPRRPDLTRSHIADYYGMISHIDQNVGKILKCLKDTGKLDDTVIVYTGDNGLALGQHGLFGKGSVYNHSVRVPLVLAGPGISRSEICSAKCYISDLFPTLCDICSLDIPSSVETHSIYPVMNHEKEETDSIFFAYMNLMRSVWKGKYKLIEFYRDESLGTPSKPWQVCNPEGAGTGPETFIDGKGTRRTLLFDIGNDPFEIKNLASREEFTPIIDELQINLKEWQDKTDDPLRKQR